MSSFTDSELLREVEALKTHRRNSANRPILDPDLPDLAATQVGGRDGEARPERRGVDLVDSGYASTPERRRTGSEPGARLEGGRANFTARRRGAGASASAAAGGTDVGQSAARPAPARRPTHDEDVPLSRPKDPSHLFWVPASVHPEISPSDFRRFLHEHASRAVRDHEATVEAAPSSSRGPGLDVASALPPGLVSRSTSLARRGSTLRRQYEPEKDTDEGASSSNSSSPLPTPPPSRLGSAGPTLSIEDLQQLERLAEEASLSQDPSQLRSVLRRTMSLNTSGSALDAVDALPSETEDAPLIVPRPGQILRRAARTKIRKSSLSSEGGRAGIRRRAGAGMSSGPGEGEEGKRSLDDDGTELRRQSDQSELSASALDEGASTGSSRPLSDEAAGVYRDSMLSDASQRTSVTSLTDDGSSSQRSSRQSTESGVPTVLGGERRTPSPEPPITPTQSTPYYPELTLADEPLQDDMPRQPNDGIRPVPVSHVPPPPSFEKAGKPITTQQQKQQAREVAPPQVVSVSPPVPPQQQLPVAGQPQRAPSPGPSRGKEKKGGFASWFGLSKDDDDSSSTSSSSRRARKEKREYNESMSERTEKERESSGFLGALFGKKKGSDDSLPHGYTKHHDGHITAGSLLDRGLHGGKPYLNYYRYPIHVERAVYRLSHIKLANPRRPLYEQVLISNLMFWYLSIINRAQVQQQLQQQQMLQHGHQAQQMHSGQQQHMQQGQQAQGHGGDSATAGAAATAGGAGGMYAGQNSPPEHNGGDRGGEGGYGDAHPVHEEPKPTGQSRSKRGSLVKLNRAPPGSRSAEMAIPAAGYGAQHRQINNDLAMQQGALGGSHGHRGGYSQPAASAPALSVGQVVDARVLQAHTAFSSAPAGVPVGVSAAEPTVAEPVIYDGDSIVGSGPRMSSRGSNASAAPSSSSAAWLSNGGSYPVTSSASVDKVTSRPRDRNGRPSKGSSDIKTDEHAWLGTGSLAASLGQGLDGTRGTDSREGRRGASESDAQAWDGGVAPRTRHNSASPGSMSSGGGEAPRPRKSSRGSARSVSTSASAGANASHHDTTRSVSGGATADEIAALKAAARLNGDSTGSGFENGSGYAADAPSHRPSSPPAAILLGSPGSAAMLEAARLSQSRRR